MATVTRIVMTDDLDGSEDAVSTISIALDKVSDEIDLSAAQRSRLRDKLARFVDAATEVKSKPATAARTREVGGGRPAPDPTRSRRRRSGRGPGPTGTKSPTAGVSPRPSKQPSAPLTRRLAPALSPHRDSADHAARSLSSVSPPAPRPANPTTTTALTAATTTTPTTVAAAAGPTHSATLLNGPRPGSPAPVGSFSRPLTAEFRAGTAPGSP